MKKFLFLCVGVFFMFNLFAQKWYFEKPDYNEIEKNIADKKSSFYYPQLMVRYQLADSTMTWEEKRHLYYGYIFDKNYEPYGTSDFSDSLSITLRKEDHSDSILNKIIEWGDSVLKENPFDIRTLNSQIYAFKEKNDRKNFDRKMIQMKIVIDALISSGNGLNKEKAFYVIYTDHEYDLLEILGFQFGGSQKLIELYDYLTLAENEHGIKGLYFDVSPCLNSLNEMFKK